MAKKNVLCIIEGFTPPHELMLIKPLNILKFKREINFTVLLIRDFIRLTPIAVRNLYEKHDIIFISRIMSKKAYFLIFDNLKFFSRKTVYFIDDDLININEVRENDKKISAFENWTLNFISKCNKIVVASKNLYNAYKDYNNDIELYKLYAPLNYMINKYHKLRIGYAAIDHHVEDFKKVLPSIISILTEYPEIELDLFFAEPLEELNNFSNINYLTPVSSVDDFYKLVALRGWSIGIAPLRTSEFVTHKSNNKYREYAALKIAGIYEDLEPYKCVIHNKTGMLSNTQEDWYINIKKLIDDSNLRNFIIKNARLDVLKNYNINETLDMFRRIINDSDI